MTTNKIIFPVLCAIILLAGGYWLWGGGKSVEVKNDDQMKIELNNKTTQTQDSSTVVSTTTTTSQTDTNKKIMFATLHTNKGDITIQFYNDVTPKTVENFVKLSQEGFYDNTKFHRVIKGFMSQGGDPLSKDDAQMARWGTGGPGYTFADEITATNSNDVDTIAMANAGPNTNGSQFFINAANNAFLNTKHTVFGKVVEGKDVVAAINVVPTVPGDRPVDPVVIKSITLK